MNYRVEPIAKQVANDAVVKHHYLHRRPSNSYSFGLFDNGELVGVCIFGAPASRHLQVGVCPSGPDLVLELKRLWVSDGCPTNSESFFVSRALKALPARLVVSYADTRQGHDGIIYRALNFHYAGWTDMDRKTARYDYLPEDGSHSRNAFRGSGKYRRVRRKPKARYWIATGNRRERRDLEALCAWPRLSWREHPVPFEHKQLKED